MHQLTNILLETATHVASSSPSTSSMLENMVIFISVVIASAGLVILFIIITVAIIIFILRRRNNKISQHPVSINEQVELQQNKCYSSFNFDNNNDKQQQYVCTSTNHIVFDIILTCPAGFIFILKSIKNKMM